MAFALRNGALLNAGSSDTARSSACTEPEKSARLRLPSLTVRCNALLKLASSVGLNRLASKKKDNATAATIKTAMTIAVHLKSRFILQVKHYDFRGSRFPSACRG